MASLFTSYVTVCVSVTSHRDQEDQHRDQQDHHELGKPYYAGDSALCVTLQGGTDGNAGRIVSKAQADKTRNITLPAVHSVLELQLHSHQPA